MKNVTNKDVFPTNFTVEDIKVVEREGVEYFMVTLKDTNPLTNNNLTFVTSLKEGEFYAKSLDRPASRLG